MDTKHLTCMDEEFLVQIDRPADKNGGLIITFSLTRTYLFTDVHQPQLDTGMTYPLHRINR